MEQLGKGRPTASLHEALDRVERRLVRMQWNELLNTLLPIVLLLFS